MEALHKMKAKYLVLLLPLLMFASGSVFGQAFSVDNVVGLYNTDTLKATDQVVFYLRMSNLDSGKNVAGIANGWRVYSPDGATWTQTTIDTVYHGFKDIFTLVFGGFAFSVDGTVSDTVAFAGSYLGGAGLPAGFNEIAYSVTIGPIDPSTNHGKQICIDSAYFRPTGTWKWVFTGATGGGNSFPSWDGPHCYTIVDTMLLDVNVIPGAGLPTKFALNQNYPNPFNPSTEIRFDLPTRSQVSIEIYNVLGQKVKTLVDEEKPAGPYIVDWNGTSDNGTQVSSGVYFYRMQAGSFVETKKMMLLK